MKLNKIVALLLALAMVFSLAACGEDTPNPSETPTGSNPAPTDPKPTDPKDPVVVDGDVSIDFEDGNYGFVAIYEGRPNSDASTLEVVENCGNKALKVTNGSGKVPYVAFDLVSLLGENAAKVRSIEMTIGIENPDGKFYACSGNLILWTGDKLSSTSYGWSVYMQNKNPKLASFALKDYESISADNPVVVLTLETDNGAAAGAANANIYIHNVSFKDADGKLIAADSSATFAAPKNFSGEKDMSNLQALKGGVSLDGMSGLTGTAWGQNGVEMTADFLAALVPGSVIEIEFNSAAGDMWIVMPDSVNTSWTRVCQQTAATNNSKNICQITFEQIAAACASENPADWGARLQCESSGDWTVFSVKVGKPSGLVNTAGKTTWYEGSITGGAWGQAGIDLTADMIAAMVPGSVIEVKYTTASPTGDLWIVMPDSVNTSWTRVCQQTAACDGATMQITFEQIAAACGSENPADWGARLQLESDGEWEVYSITLCKSAFKNLSGLTTWYEGSITGGAWGQAGIDLTADMIAAMVPGSVIEVKYTTASPTGDLWIVMPDSANTGWTRVQQQTATCDGATMQISFEQIAAACGSENPADWGARLQLESDGEWEVYSISIGTSGAA